MPSANEIMNDINLRYRNSFTTEQKLIWLNEEQRELFDVLEIDSPPYGFTTVSDNNYYPFPAGFDVTKIKVVSMQVNDSTDSPAFREIESKRNDDNVYATNGYWYTVVSDSMFINSPGDMPANRLVYIYCDADPTEVTLSTMNLPPDLPTKYHEILKFGVLKRIAGARKDAVMQSNYDASYQEKIVDVLWERKQKDPEFVQPTSTQKFRSRGW